MPAGKGNSTKSFDKEFDKWDNRRQAATAAEAGMNARETIGEMKEVMDQINEGAEMFQGVTTEVAAVNQEATTAGVDLQAMEMDTDNIRRVVDGGAREVGEFYNIDGAAGGLTGMGETAAVNGIVDGHRHIEVIEGTVLEEPVRFMAEEVAVPCYKKIGETCFGCCFDGNAAENVDRAGQIGETVAGATGGASEGLGCLTSWFENTPRLLDSASWCLVDDALAYALPFLGTLFSCFRLYQGTLLSCKGCLGRCRGGDDVQKKRFQWMAAEGHARLWQGCCGLIGAAPGLIIVTLPLILACGFVASKAKKKRTLLETGGNEADGTENGVVQSQPSDEECPDRDELWKDYENAKRVVTGKKVAGDADLDEELVAKYQVSEEANPYPNAPRGEWSTGLCGCFEHFPSCVTACLCTCITVGQAARLFKGVFYAVVATYLIDCVFGCGGILIMFCGTYAIAKARSRVARHYRIPINKCGNCCLSFWCGCCVVSQVARHLFAWDSTHYGRCQGWLECGPRPASHWEQVSCGESDRNVGRHAPSSCQQSQFRQDAAAAPAPPPYQQFQFQQNGTTAPVPPAYDQMMRPSYDEMVKAHAPSAVAPMDRC
ncbi:unnamed protein product [Ectocarpus sp. 12 AP-2014]